MGFKFSSANVFIYLLYTLIGVKDIMMANSRTLFSRSTNLKNYHILKKSHSVICST